MIRIDFEGSGNDAVVLAWTFGQAGIVTETETTGDQMAGLMLGGAG
jgi:hypothetical protein